jgi:hypothetical protein
MTCLDEDQLEEHALEHIDIKDAAVHQVQYLDAVAPVRKLRGTTNDDSDT